MRADLRAFAACAATVLIYLAIGAVVATVARNPVNGTVLILFVLAAGCLPGPSGKRGERGPDDHQILATHFVTSWMVDLALRHGGRLSDLGWAIVWTVGAAPDALVIDALTRDP